MSCRHDLANGTCLECYPATGTVNPGPGPHEPNLDGPGAVPELDAMRARAERAEAERDAMRTKLEALEAVQYDLMRERDEARARLRVLEEAAREAHRLLRVSLSTDAVDRIGVSMAATDLWRALGSLPSQKP